MTGCLKIKTGTVKVFLFFALLFVTVVSLTGCIDTRSFQPQPHSGLSHNFSNLKHSPDDSFIAGKAVPITVVDGDFNMVSGWVSDERILYITNVDKGSHIYLYDLFTGVSTLFYKSDFPIVNVEISPSKKQVLVHSAPSSYEGELKVIDLDATVRYETRIESFELAFEWSIGNENEVLVSAFKEDWSYTTFILNINEQKSDEVELSQPFVIWPTEDVMLYLDWKDDSPALNAPLMKRSSKSKKEQKILSSVHQVDSSSKFVIAIYTNDKDLERATYVFMNHDFEQISTFEVPQLSAFSGWLVPYYEIIDSRNSFVYFRPLYSGEADLYGSGFTLAEYSFEEGKEVEVFNDLANEPLSCSPGGTNCLYGYQFEKLIDLEKKEIINLIEK